MKKMKYAVKLTSQFRRDYKLAMKRGLEIELLDKTIVCLAEGAPMPEGNRDHALTGSWSGYRECHIRPDWLLIYRIENDELILTLTRTGSHSDLFEN